MTRVVYIAGYGRSGSTLLERILASADGVRGAGEVRNLLMLVDTPHHRCACGALLSECPVWGPVLDAVRPLVDRHGAALLRAQLALEGLAPRAWVRPASSGAVDAYREVIRRTFAAVGQGAAWVVDSSKTDRLSWRRPAVLASAGIDVRVVHLVRDPRGCLSSTRKGDNRKLERGEDPRIPWVRTRTTLSWLGANAAAEASAGLRVRYEDLVASPATTLARIGAHLGVDLASARRALASGSLPPTHQLTGNRMRNQREVRLRADEGWRRRLGWVDRAAVAVIDGPLALRYGYRLP